LNKKRCRKEQLRNRLNLTWSDKRSMCSMIMPSLSLSLFLSLCLFLSVSFSLSSSFSVCTGAKAMAQQVFPGSQRLYNLALFFPATRERERDKEREKKQSTASASASVWALSVTKAFLLTSR